METHQPLSRHEALSLLAGAELDVLVVGGGIVGAGIARDAALRGLHTGLVEQHDFAYGTSSRSSRLLHGGLRYLAQGRIGLVREAGTEKGIVQRIAPHVSEPLAFLFPTYQAMPWGQWPLWKLAVGVRIYDLLAGIRNGARRSSSLGSARMRGLLSELNAERLTGGVRYFDGLTNDARLVIDTLRSAAKAGASVANYTRLIHSERVSGVWECIVRDEVAGKEIAARAKCVVNATGPWADGLKHSSVRLRPTKGVHLVIARDRLPVPEAVVMIAGSRILFAIPWGERVILGTTDTDYEGRPEDVAAEDPDVDYILSVVNSAFPAAELSGRDVISAWAGLRPLIAARNGGPSDISRSHEIRTPEPGWWDVAGGKLTTYRLMAEQTVDRIQAYVGRKSECVTASQPLLDPDETDGISAIVPPDPSRALVEHFCAREWSVHLEDVMLRRGGWTHYHADDDAVAARVADWMASALGWSEDARSRELDRYIRSAERYARVPAPAVTNGGA